MILIDVVTLKRCANDQVSLTFWHRELRPILPKRSKGAVIRKLEYFLTLASIDKHWQVGGYGQMRTNRFRRLGSKYREGLQAIESPHDRML